MFTWARQRQLLYGLGVLAFFIVFVGLPVYFAYFNKPPTCFDNKQNGDERGVDCGGSCARACQDEVLPEPIVLWARPFTVARGLNNLVAYVQNPNVNYTAEPMPYIFLVYDKENVLLGTREGYARIPPTKTFPIFEPAFDAGTREPAKAIFEFTAPANWNKNPATEPAIDVVDEQLFSASSSPYIRASLANRTINRYKNIEVVAIVYDAAGNAFAASKTVVDVLDPNSQAPLVFTWPQPFVSDVSKIEIIPKLYQ